MKVIYVTPRPFSLAFGGLEIQLIKTKEAVEKKGLTVELLDHFSMDQVKSADLVHLFGSETVLYQMAMLIRAQGIPLVVSSIFYPIGFSRIKYYLSARLYKTEGWLRRLVITSANLVLPNSNSEARLVQKIFDIDLDHLRVIPNGVDHNFIGEDPEGFRSRYIKDLPREEPFILSVGRIEHRKNSLTLLRAAAKLKVPIVFIGHRNQLEREYLTRFFAELDRYPGYAKYIDFVPHDCWSLASAYAAAHVHALVSWLETPGLASLEAGLNGANLVVGDCMPVHEYFKDLAWIIPPNNVTQIANALEKAMNAPRNVRRQKELIRQRYTWDATGDATIQAYTSILSKGD